MTYRGTDGLGPTPAVVTEAVEEAVAIVTGMQAAVVAIGVVVNLGTTACHYFATYFGLVVLWTAAGSSSVSLAIVAAVRTNVSAIVAAVSNVWTNSAAIVAAVASVRTNGAAASAVAVAASVAATSAWTNS